MGYAWSITPRKTHKNFIPNILDNLLSHSARMWEEYYSNIVKRLVLPELDSPEDKSNPTRDLGIRLLIE
jgi:hypothetical protein